LWSAPSDDLDEDGLGDGIYDPLEWAVVFKYSSVTINANRTLSFLNHPSKAPVIWLVDGDVTISGTLDHDGQDGTNDAGVASIAGPGGYRGGRTFLSDEGSAGFGPGGAGYVSGVGSGSSSGSYAQVGTGGLAGEVYGNQTIVPLIGGSGAAGNAINSTNGGGAGGGAILIAASGTIAIGGTVRANGGKGNTDGGSSNYAGGGSGGAIRLIADTVTGSGILRCVGGQNAVHVGGEGRIRIEANSISIGSSPNASEALPGDPPLYDIWPPPLAPTLSAVMIEYTDAQSGMPETVMIPTDPEANLNFPLQDRAIDTEQDITLHIAATNVSTDWVVTVRVVPKSGNSFSIDPDINGDPPPVGDDTAWTRTVTFALPRGIAALQLRAAMPK
jgi:hypothetical protein